MKASELIMGVEEGNVDTIMLALPDMQGRLQGKRLTVPHFQNVALSQGIECCAYLLATDAEMAPADGYAMSSWANGYGDLILRPDVSTLRMLPWHQASAVCLADAEWFDGRAVPTAPRQLLRSQIARLEEQGFIAEAATELEFLVFLDSYRHAAAADYRNLRPSSRHNNDYSLLGTSHTEPLIRRIRNEMAAAGMHVEASKGECNRGQHEITFRYGPVLKKADEHVVFKQGAKEIAEQEDMSLTFMSKFDEAEGNSCHIHLSLTDRAGSPVFARDRTLFERFLAGQLACLREFTLLYAPNVNSYKRFASASFAPTSVAWGEDNRTCALRVVGERESLRIEHRVPGGDVNPYLAISAMLAAGLHGIDAELELPEPHSGSAYESDAPPVPATLGEARDLFRSSSIARTAFGNSVVDHYAHAAEVELSAFGAAVTDWERVRGFERL